MQGFLDLSMVRRRTVCEEAQARMRLRAASVEKDFWVCWTLREFALIAAFTRRGVWPHPPCP